MLVRRTQLFYIKDITKLQVSKSIARYSPLLKDISYVLNSINFKLYKIKNKCNIRIEY